MNVVAAQHRDGAGGSIESLAGVLVELAPLVRRVANLDPASPVRIRVVETRAAALCWLPFGVLASRTVPVGESIAHPYDHVHHAGELWSWLDPDAGAARGPAPVPHDGDWQVGLPPVTGWRRVDTVPDDVIRPLVRAGATTLARSAEDAGLAGATPRSDTVEALLDSIVLTVTAGPAKAEVSLRLLSALTRMGFLARDSWVSVDLAGRWLRVVAEYGTVYAERPGLSLNLAPADRRITPEP